MKYLIGLGLLLSVPAFSHESANHEPWLTNNCDLEIVYNKAQPLLQKFKVNMQKANPIGYANIVLQIYTKSLKHLRDEGCRTELRELGRFDSRIFKEANLENIVFNFYDRDKIYKTYTKYNNQSLNSLSEKAKQQKLELEREPRISYNIYL